jgi:mono/diheme cytochrome c family protein
MGRKRFDITCATCHGPLGDGESIVARNMALRPPPSLHKYNDRPVGYFYEVITKGFGMMASYAAELTVDERWSIIAYIRALQLSQATPIADVPADVRQQLEALGPGMMNLPTPGAPGEGHAEPSKAEEKR